MVDGAERLPGRNPTRRVVTLAALGLGLAACAPAPSATSRTTAGGPAPSSASPAPSTQDASPSATPTAAVSSAGEAPTPSPQPSAASPAPPAHSLTDPASQWVVINKRRPLEPLMFVPELAQPDVPLAISGGSAMLNPTTARAAEALFAAAANAGVGMTFASGYRSYATQQATYASQVAAQGQDLADVASARPGYSEHQTGWAFDLGAPGGTCSFEPCFANLPAAQWVAAHGHEHGFIVRYPWMLHEITGYFYEPWHVRFIGVEAATEMHQNGIGTLEEYFGLPAAPTY